jgi:1-deoxy-D-xylulose-5-phosphate synthase
MIGVAEEAADLMKREGALVGIVNARFIKPLDEEMLLAIAEQGNRIIVLEEGAELGGFGSSVLEFYSRKGLYEVPVRIIGVPDLYVEHGSIEQQREEVGLTAEHVAAELRAMNPRRMKRVTGQA